jgi:hypothetical protein
MQNYCHVSVMTSAVPLIERTKMAVTCDSDINLYQRDTLCGRISQSCFTLSSAIRSSLHLHFLELLTNADHGEQQSRAGLLHGVGARL